MHQSWAEGDHLGIEGKPQHVQPSAAGKLTQSQQVLRARQLRSEKRRLEQELIPRARREASTALERFARLPRVTGSRYQQARNEAEHASVQLRALKGRLARVERELASLPNQRVFAGLSVAEGGARPRRASSGQDLNKDQRMRQAQVVGRRRLVEDISGYGDPVPDPALMMDPESQSYRGDRTRRRRRKST